MEQLISVIQKAVDFQGPDKPVTLGDLLYLAKMVQTLELEAEMKRHELDQQAYEDTFNPFN